MRASTEELGRLAAPPAASPRHEVHVSTRAHRVVWLIALVPLLAVLASPWWAGRSTLHLLGEFAYMLALAQMWNLLAGYGGMVSVGQQAFIGLGAYGLLVFAMLLKGNPFVGVLVGGLIAGLASLLTAPIVFRLRNAYFAIGTWVVSEVFRLLIANIPALGGGSGMSLTSALTDVPAWWREAVTFWIAIALGVGTTLLSYVFLLSRMGLGLTALRDSEVASESLGLRVRVLKLAVYVVSATGCGVAGALIYLSKLRVAPDAAFSIDWAAGMIFIVVIGGIGTLEGPVIGTLVFLLLRGFLEDFGTWYMILLGTVAIVAMRWAPQGIWGWAAARFRIQLFPVQRRVSWPPPPREKAQRAR
ncbi:MAG TPA: branched-chain amino acid ABC transporter permease [Burkholderiaceae bacterium]